MDALRQFREYSTWRKHDIVIDPHEVYALNFTDSMPNIFVVNNPNTATLKIGISSIPRVDSYEFKVEYNTTETFGRPFGSAVIYILNDSSVPVKIGLFSIEKDFDPALLKNMNVSLAGYTLEASSTIDGIKEGVMLPVRIDTDTFEKINLLHTDMTQLKEVVECIKNSMGSSVNNEIRGEIYSEQNFVVNAVNDTIVTIKWLYGIDQYNAIIYATISHPQRGSSSYNFPTNVLLHDIEIAVPAGFKLEVSGDASTVLSGSYSYKEV